MTHDDDVAFLKDSDKWPCWPVCPVRKSQEDRSPICGLVFAGQQHRVVQLNLFHGWTPELYDAAEKFEYESVEELVADGWMVD